MLLISNIAHEDATLAVVDFAPVATPLAFDPNRVRAALGETARIEGDDAIGMSSLAGDLRHQHLDQRAMMPRGDTDACLDDLSFDIDQSGDVVWSKNSNAPFPQSLRSSHHPLLLLHYTLMCTILIRNEW